MVNRSNIEIFVQGRKQSMASLERESSKTTASSALTTTAGADEQNPGQPEDDRQALRKRCLAQRKSIEPSLKKQYDAAIIARLMAWLDKHPAPCPSEALLALWWPIRSEPDWRPFAGSFRKAGWRLALPCVDGSDKPLGFARYEENTVLRQAALGVMEPEDAPRIRPWVIAAPCVGFFQSYRLGYGGGYYDRSLALLDEQARARAVAIAYSACEVIFEPRAHDLAFGGVITECASLRDKG
jgi:5,10-methenyltetrahydrofolate synthetase